MASYSHGALLRSKKLIADAAEAGYGPATPRPQRDEKIRELGRAGAIPSEIAELFGVTRETVRAVRHGLITRALTDAEWQLIKAARAGSLVRAGALLGQLIPPQGDDSDDKSDSQPA